MKKIEEKYLARPKTKPTQTQRGKMNTWDNGYAEFVPWGTRENQRQVLKQLGDSSFYKTRGKKESSYSLHLNIDGESHDPVAEMEEQFRILTEGQRKQKPQLPQQGRMLYDDGQHLKFWLDPENNQVCIMTHLDCSPQIERQLLQLQGDMGRVLGRFRSEIINNNNK